jgi:endonuclease/exonuclease/phosphatase family metal-dependent hydrolase
MLRNLCLLLLAAATSQAGELRVLSWNLHHGVGEDDKLDLERIATLIREQKPDLVALQEVDRKCGRTKGVDQAAELARLTGLQMAFGKAMDFDGGEYGQAVLSRFPIASSQVHRLPGDGEPRIAFEAEVKIEGKPLRMITVHLDHQQDDRRLKQAETLVKALENRHEPMVLAGDFNDGPESAALAAFAAPWQAALKKEPKLTCPASKPSSEIDHILLRGLEPKEPAAVLPEGVASDHRPVLLVVKVPEVSTAP